MNPLKFLSGLIVISAFLIFPVSCIMDTKTIEPYLLKVDSVAVSDTVKSRTLFAIRLIGTVGPDGCYAFEKTYQYTTDKKEIMMEVWAKYKYEGLKCPQGVVYLDETVEMTVSSAGDYMLKILQPDNSYLEKKITAI